MENSLKKSLKILAIVGVALAFVGIINYPISLITQEFIPDVMLTIELWIRVAAYMVLTATAIISIFLIKGLFNKIAQAVVSLGILMLFVMEILRRFDVILPISIAIIFYAVLTLGGVLWLVSLCVKKFRLNTKSIYFFGLEILVLGLVALLSLIGLEELGESDILMRTIRVLLSSCAMLFFAMELKEENSYKNLLWFAILTFVAASASFGLILFTV